MSTIVKVSNLKKTFKAKTDIAGLFSGKNAAVIKAVELNMVVPNIHIFVNQSFSTVSTIRKDET